MGLEKTIGNILLVGAAVGSVLLYAKCDNGTPTITENEARTRLMEYLVEKHEPAELSCVGDKNELYLSLFKSDMKTYDQYDVVGPATEFIAHVSCYDELVPYPPIQYKVTHDKIERMK